MGKLCGMNKFYPIIINTLDDKFNNYTFHSVEEAVKKHKDINHWIWLDHRGDIYLDEFDHPKETSGIAYCIGSDYDGFENFDFDSVNSSVIKVRPEGEHYANIVAHMTMYDRFLYLNDRRK